MSHEAAPRSNTTTLEHPDAASTSEQLDSPEQQLAREILRDNPMLRAQEKQGVDLALSDLDELKKLDKPFLVGINYDTAIVPKAMPITIRRGRSHLNDKADEARKNAENYKELEKKEREKVQASHHDKYSSRKSRKLARKEIREDKKAKRLTHKANILTHDVTKDLEQKWGGEKNPLREAEGFKTLKDDLSKIEPELTKRRKLRTELEELEEDFNDGTLEQGSSRHAKYLAYKKEMASWNESDEDLADGMKTEAVAKYRKWLADRDLEEKAGNYKTAEGKIHERLNVEKKINDQNTPADERENLKEWASKLAPLKEFAAKLVQGDIEGFSDWIEKDANREFQKAVETIGNNASKQFTNEMKELGNILDEYKELLEQDEWYEEQLANASTTEEKAQWQKLLDKNGEKLTELKQKMDQAHTKIDAERIEDEAFAENAARNRIEVTELWDSQKNS